VVLGEVLEILEVEGGERQLAGGHAVIGNLGTANPTHPLMELILDWPLHHRSASDLRQLFGDFGTGVTIEQETTGVNLFAVISA
jgi:hypothetical protein